MAQQTFSGVPGTFSAGEILTASDQEKLREFILYLIKDGDETDTGEVSPLILDLGNDRVGINDATPSVTLDVTGNMRTSTGLLFGADTAAANQLDDYEEGTWTPVITFATGGDVTTTFTAGGARYTKIGRQVTASFNNVSPSSLNTGVVRISGLPFTATATNYPGFGPVQFSAASLATGENFIQMYTRASSDEADLIVQSTTGHAFIQHTDITTGTAMYGSLTYLV